MTASSRSSTANESRRRSVVLGICCLSVFVTGVDLTIINVALPSIGRDLGSSVSGLQWTIDAYTLVIACLLMLSGSLADRFGRRRVFLIGLATFSIGSLLCSVSSSLGELVAFRGLQAVGGAMLNPVAISIIAATFTEPAERARAVGVWGSVVGLSLAAGPVLGGLLISAVDWRAIFWLNVPVGALAIALTARWVPESRAEHPRRLDPMGQLLVISTLGPLTGAVIEGPRQGWSSAVIVALFAVAIVSAMALVLLEPRRREPLIDLRFFRSAPFAGATLIAVVALVANAGFLFLNTLYLQDARGYSPLHAGLLMIPLAGAVAICSNLSGKIITRRGPRLALCLAGLLIAIGNGLMITVSAHTAVWFLVLAYVVFGAGAGLVGAPITNTALSGMPRDQSGVAGAIASTGRQIGSAIGVAVTGSILAGSSAALVHASRPAWAVLAGCGVGTLVLGFASTGRWAQASAQRNGERLAAEAATAR